MEDLIGVGVSDYAKQCRVSQRTLESVVLAQQALREFFQRAFERLQAAATDLLEILFASHDIKRCAPCGARFRENQGAVIEIECSESHFSGNLASGCEPLEAARDHQMDHDPEICLESQRNALSNPLNFCSALAFGFHYRWLD